MIDTLQNQSRRPIPAWLHLSHMICMFLLTTSHRACTGVARMEHNPLILEVAIGCSMDHTRGRLQIVTIGLSVWRCGAAGLARGNSRRHFQGNCGISGAGVGTGSQYSRGSHLLKGWTESCFVHPARINPQQQVVERSHHPSS
eukprot:gene6403-biopygen23875